MVFFSAIFLSLYSTPFVTDRVHSWYVLLVCYIMCMSFCLNMCHVFEFHLPEVVFTVLPRDAVAMRLSLFVCPSVLLCLHGVQAAVGLIDSTMRP